MKFTNTYCIERWVKNAYWELSGKLFRQHQVSEKEKWQVYHHVDKHVFHQFAPIVNKIEQEFLK